MKKVFLFFVIAFAVAACGPKQTQQVATEVDSVVTVDTVAPADTVAQVDSVAPKM